MEKLAFRKVFDSSYQFTIGKANLLTEGEDATIICCGTAVARCLQVRDTLADKDISVKVLEMSCIKPLDEGAVLRAAAQTGVIVTVEEATVVGGLGSAGRKVSRTDAPCWRSGLFRRVRRPGGLNG